MIEELITIVGTAGAVLAVVLPLQLLTVNRLERIESRLGDLEARVSMLEARMDRLEARFDRLEGRFDSLASSMSVVAQRVAHVEGIVISSREASEAAIQ